MEQLPTVNSKINNKIKKQKGFFRRLLSFDFFRRKGTHNIIPQETGKSFLEDYRSEQGAIFLEMKDKLPDIFKIASESFDNMLEGMEQLQHIQLTKESLPVSELHESGKAHMQAFLFKLLLFTEKFRYQLIIDKIFNGNIANHQTFEEERALLTDLEDQRKLTEIYEFRIALGSHYAFVSGVDRLDGALRNIDDTLPIELRERMSPMQEDLRVHRKVVEILLDGVQRNITLPDIEQIPTDIKAISVQALFFQVQKALCEMSYKARVPLPIPLKLEDGTNIPIGQEKYYFRDNNVVNLSYQGVFKDTPESEGDLVFRNFQGKMLTLTREKFVNLKLIDSSKLNQKYFDKFKNLYVRKEDGAYLTNSRGHLIEMSDLQVYGLISDEPDEAKVVFRSIDKVIGPLKVEFLSYSEFRQKYF